MRIFCHVNNISDNYDLETITWLTKKFGENNVIPYNCTSSYENTFTIIVDDGNYENHISYLLNKFMVYSKKTYIIGHIISEKINRLFGISQFNKEYIDIPKTDDYSQLFMIGNENNIKKYEESFVFLKENIEETIDSEKVYDRKYNINEVS